MRQHRGSETPIRLLRCYSDKDVVAVVSSSLRPVYTVYNTCQTSASSTADISSLTWSCDWVNWINSEWLSTFSPSATLFTPFPLPPCLTNRFNYWKIESLILGETIDFTFAGVVLCLVLRFSSFSLFENQFSLFNVSTLIVSRRRVANDSLLQSVKVEECLFIFSRREYYILTRENAFSHGDNTFVARRARYFNYLEIENFATNVLLLSGFRLVASTLGLLFGIY